MEEFSARDTIGISDSALWQITDLFTSFQLKHKPTDRASCPLCKMDLTKEHVYYEDEKILVVDTQKKKGHRNRLMVLMKEHGIQQDRETLNEAVRELIAVGKQIFEEDFILLSDRYSSINYHWHIVACDLDPEAEDYQQILETPYVLIKQFLQIVTLASQSASPSSI